MNIRNTGRLKDTIAALSAADGPVRFGDIPLTRAEVAAALKVLIAIDTVMTRSVKSGIRKAIAGGAEWGNAKNRALDDKQTAEFIRLVRAGERVSVVAAQFKINRITGYKILRRAGVKVPKRDAYAT